VAWSTASGRQEVEAALRRAAGESDANLDVAGTALLFAALDRPQEDLAPYRRHLQRLADDSAELAEALGAEESLPDRVAVLRGVLVERHGYLGDEADYDNLDNADLPRVIDRRRGLPVALGILYLHCARSRGWDAAGLAFPGHFLLRLALGGERVIIDPFNGGETREAADLRRLLKAAAGRDAELAPAHFEPVGSRDILLRLQNNIKIRRLRAGQKQKALQTMEAMLMLAPATPSLWREAGLLHAQLGNLRAALLALDNVLELVPSVDPLHREAVQTMAAIRARLN